MKKTSLILVVVLLSVLLIGLTGCKEKYCSVSGCPSESAKGSDYCYQHKCANFNCTNKGALSTPYSYCTECIERAQ